jgi:phytoene desaturase
MTNYTTLIVGGGLGGLAAAIRLAAAGRSVTLLEKNERVGGKLNIVAEGGYTFDTGPSLLTMPWVIDELFAAAGRSREDYLQFVQIEPTCRYFWQDGTRFDAYQRMPQLVQEVERIAPDDVRGLFRFLAYSSQIYDAVADTFLLRPFTGLRELITPQLVGHSLRIDALRSVDGAVRSFFRSPYLRQVFNRYATYNGSSPYISPATFNVIAYIEFAEGGWYVQGGMYELGRALARLACELGVAIHTNSEVSEVLVRQGRACGVRLLSGEELRAEQVLVNADPRYAYQHLVPGQQAMAKRLAALEPSCSGYVLLLGVDREYEQLAHHNIFFSEDYRREFDTIFRRRMPYADPTVYVAASSRTDPQHAPPGHMNFFVLVNAPALSSAVNWQKEAAPYRETVLRKLERMGLSDLRRHIVYEQCWTPAEIAARYNAADGAIYGLSSNNPFVAFLRPPLKAHGLQGLYFVGGGTHPGGGIPLVLLSGRAVAEQMLGGG